MNYCTTTCTARICDYAQSRVGIVKHQGTRTCATWCLIPNRQTSPTRRSISSSDSLGRLRQVERDLRHPVYHVIKCRGMHHAPNHGYHLSHEIEGLLLMGMNPRASTRDKTLAIRSHFPPLIRGALNPVLWGVQPKVVGPVEAMVLLRLAMARSANDLYTVLGSRNVWL
jgi:hypothetical protein